MLATLVFVGRSRQSAWQRASSWCAGLPHAGGAGLCECVQHISLVDYICASASLENHVIEYVDHLQEKFVDPVVISNGHYMPLRSLVTALHVARNA